MAIHVVCPNGHTLKVKDSLAGKTGVCPVCKTRVRIPGSSPKDKELSEEAILGIIGPYEPDPVRIQTPIEDPVGTRKPPGGSTPGTKVCEKCNLEVPAETHICPYCRTYMAGLSDLTKNL